MNKSERKVFPNKVARILAVTIGGLGDAILFSPVLKALRKRFPEAQTTLLCASPLVDEAYGHCKEVDQIAFLPINGLNKFWQTIQFLKIGVKYRFKGGIDIGVFATGLNSRLIAFLKMSIGLKNIYPAPSPPDYPTDFLCNLALSSDFYKDAVRRMSFFLHIRNPSSRQGTPYLNSIFR